MKLSVECFFFVICKWIAINNRCCFSVFQTAEDCAANITCKQATNCCQYQCQNHFEWWVESEWSNHTRDWGSSTRSVVYDAQSCCCQTCQTAAEEVGSKDRNWMFCNDV